ncbi:MAG: hypothetical protein HLUCCO06_06105 [Halomonas sp. HL-93]|nr:MAG: hypothetical protein HLUCCO06_06105 [Halomonas sp. HL-93]
MVKVAIFIDVQNVYYTVREAYGRNFDYNLNSTNKCSTRGF